MILRIDLHVHTINSGDSTITIKDAIRRCKEERLDGFAITDHDIFTKNTIDLQVEEDLIIIQGIEVTARGAHIIALGINEPLSPKLSITETVEKIHDQNSLAILAHPFSVFRTWVNSQEIEDASLDAIEVANAAQFPYNWMLKKNTALAERLSLPKTGGSDAHIPKTIGRAYTIIDSNSRDEDSVLKAIRNGYTKAEGKGISLSERLKLVK